MSTAQGEGAGIAAVRGAIDVPANTARDILERTATLLEALIEANRLEPARIVSALFTTTADLDAEFPAHAARRLGWTDVPMLHAREIPVPNSMPRIVRVLLTVSGVPRGARLVPAYLGRAAALRPDLARPPGGEGSGPARRVAIIGLGQIGGSIGLALGRPVAGGEGAAARWVRAGYDLDAATLEAARVAGAIDTAAESIAAACAGAEIAVLAVPVDELPAAIDAAAAALP
ncbi:MAG TPA: chorismate mutase, partial [Candidatus Eisenbacteria bacterium]